VYHIELRQFPHNLCHFNLDERALGAIVKAWSTDPWVEIEGRKWNPQQAKLRILEGPEIPLGQLTMGRGWRAAERNSKDVSERVLAAAKEAAGAGPPVARGESYADAALESDSLGLELLALLADGPAPLYYAWRVASKRFPQRAPAECLQLAERSVGSLLKGRLIMLLRAPDNDSSGGDQPGSDGERVGEAELEVVLRAHESWAQAGQATTVRMSRV
jgi:hypothetical protein